MHSRIFTTFYFYTAAVKWTVAPHPPGRRARHTGFIGISRTDNITLPLRSRDSPLICGPPSEGPPALPDSGSLDRGQWGVQASRGKRFQPRNSVRPAQQVGIRRAAPRLIENYWKPRRVGDSPARLCWHRARRAPRASAADWDLGDYL